MGLFDLILVLVIVGVVLYLVKTYVPMDPAVKTILTVVVVVILCIWLLRLFVGDIPIGRLS